MDVSADLLAACTRADLNHLNPKDNTMSLNLQSHITQLLGTVALAVAAAFPARAAELPADLAVKVAEVTKRLVLLASDPSVVTAVREANGRDTGGMNNGKWADVADTDPAVKSVTGGKAGTQIAKWETADNAMNKLVLRDQKGNVIAASAKPLLYNNASRPQFVNAMKGQPWAATEVKPDPTTQVPSVQVGVPVIDGGKPIGVLHAGVSAK